VKNVIVGEPVAASTAQDLHLSIVPLNLGGGVHWPCEHRMQAVPARYSPYPLVIAVRDPRRRTE
jgi:hypothetical protein